MDMKHSVRREGVVNIFGAAGYLLLFAAWTFFLAVVLSFIFDGQGMGRADEVLAPSAESSSPSAPVGSIAWVVGYILAGLAVLFSLVVLILLPYFVGKWGSKIVKAFMKVCRIDMTNRQLFFVKAIWAAVPLIGLMIILLTLRPEGMTFAVMYGVTVVLSILAIASYFVQAILARRLKISVDKLW